MGLSLSAALDGDGDVAEALGEQAVFPIIDGHHHEARPGGLEGLGQLGLEIGASGHVETVPAEGHQHFITVLHSVYFFPIFK